MAGWHILPWTYQYVLAGITALVVSYYVMLRSKKSKISKYFLGFGIFVFGWQISDFLHRNAPTAYLSGIFFGFAHIFSFISLSFLLTTIYLLIKEDFRWKNIFIIISALIGTVALLPGTYSYIWSDQLGWTYSPNFPWAYILVFYVIFLIFTILIYLLYIIKRYPALRIKASIIFLGYLVVSMIGSVISNMYLVHYPNAHPIGGILNAISFIIIGIGVALPTIKIKVREENKTSELISDLIKEIYKNIKGSVLGDKIIIFKKYVIDALGLEEIASISEKGSIWINIKSTSLNHILEIVENITAGLNSIMQLLSDNFNFDYYTSLINYVYSNIENEAGIVEANRWLEAFIKKYGNFLYRTEVIYKLNYDIDTLKKYRPKNMYLILTESPLKKKEEFLKFKDLGIKIFCITKYTLHEPSSKSEFSLSKNLHIITISPNNENWKYIRQHILNTCKMECVGIILIDCVDILIMSMGYKNFNEYMLDLKKLCENNRITLIGILNKQILKYTPPKNLFTEVIED